MWTEIISTTVGGGFGLGGAWLGAFLNRRSALDTARQIAEVDQHKYAQTRLWDAKKDAFTQVITQLNAVEKLVARILSALFDPEVDPSYYLEAAESNKDNILLWQSIWRLEDTVKNNALILPNIFQAAFTAWRADFVSYPEEAHPKEIIIAQSNSIQKHKPILTDLAKAELAATPATT